MEPDHILSPAAARRLYELLTEPDPEDDYPAAPDGGLLEPLDDAEVQRLAEIARRALRVCPTR